MCVWFHVFPSVTTLRLDMPVIWYPAKQLALKVAMQLMPNSTQACTTCH
jgi:hypothetical protein